MSAGSPELGLALHCTLQALCKSLLQRPVSVMCSWKCLLCYFSMCWNYAYALANGADAGYIFVPIASCPEHGESAIEPIALA